jgi:hypothetical protein
MKLQSKGLCSFGYQDLLRRFFLWQNSHKEKSFAKKKWRFVAQAAGLPLLKKRGKTIA